MTDKQAFSQARDELDPGREILNLEEAARFLGVSVKTFNKVLHSEELPARKIGREWKFSRQALIAWVGRGSSQDYYRESQGNGELRPPARRGPEGPAAATEGPSRGGERETVRRTSGWRLELD